MSTADEPNEASEQVGVLAATFGLDSDGLEALQMLIEEICPNLSPDFVLQLDRGHSLSAALGLPKGACENLYARAFAQFDAGHVDKARGLFSALCTLDARRADHWLGLGICLADQGQTNAAAMAFETAAQLDRSRAAPIFHMLKLHVERGQWAEAHEAIERLMPLVDDMPKLMKETATRYALAVSRHQRS